MVVLMGSDAMMFDIQRGASWECRSAGLPRSNHQAVGTRSGEADVELLVDRLAVDVLELAEVLERCQRLAMEDDRP